MKIRMYVMHGVLVSLVAACASSGGGPRRPAAEGIEFSNGELIPAGFPIDRPLAQLAESERIGRVLVTDLFFQVSFYDDPNAADTLQGYWDSDRERLNLSAPLARHPRFDTDRQAYLLGQVAVHEFGHAIFDGYMLARRGSWQKFILGEIPTKAKDRYQAIRFMRLAYGELFADALAVMQLGDLNVMAGYAATSQRSTALDSACRDFAVDCAKADLVAWKAKLAADYAKLDPDGYKYLYFGPARAAIGAALEASTLAQRQRVLGTVAKVMADDFETRFGGPAASLAKLDPLKHNQELAALIVNALR